MAVRVGINGFGRIGRLVFRVLMSRPTEFEVVQINDLAAPEMLATLLKYDTTQGKYPGSVTADATNLVVDGKVIPVTGQRDPAQCGWGERGVDVVLESTGIFSDRAGLEKHLAAGAKKVVLSAPAKGKDDVDATIVKGVNSNTITPAMKIVSNASCTTNCLAPMAKVLHETFGIVNGLMTTIHAYTNDQQVLDQIHKDPRRARAAAQNIIPTSTGAAKAVGLVIPELAGKLTGYALRVPVPVGSVTDLTVNLAKPASVKDVNAALKAAADGPLAGILEYTEDPIVSADIVHNPHSCIFDASWTSEIASSLIKVVGWYDNEWGYSNRSADIIKLLAEAN